MIIDLILDRENGKPYVPANFYRSVAEYDEAFPDIVRPILSALDGGEEEDVRRVLCDYVDEHDYNMALYSYINSVKWLEPDVKLNPMCTGCRACGVTCDGTTCQTWTGCIYREKA